MTDAKARQPIVSIRSLNKHYGVVHALKDIDLDIASGEIFAILGPSGCGKSTLLRVISGFEAPSDGQLDLDGKDMIRVPPNKRPINMVFQSYAVFPHMSVKDNVGYGLRMDKVPSGERDRRVAEVLEQVHLTNFAERMPDQLSGGQRQRVALARALVKRPRVLLLDEPLSALDAKLRDAMRLELVRLQEEVGITFIIVTHDQSEALAMADRIAILADGALRQVASPAELYERPVDAFVADFIGNMNAFNVEEILPREGGHEVRTRKFGERHLMRQLHTDLRTGTQTGEQRAIAAVRPEDVNITLGDAPAEHISVPGHLGDIGYQGQHSIVEVRLDNDDSLTAIIDSGTARELAGVAINTPLTAHWPQSDMLLLPANAATSADGSL
ncbi:MAG: spermidine/putrescine ABC transporter ATP-binding protein [Gammaproteobacteria bacterium]|nr:MAG: spermidine/putrescine ABC transporter ATP-binding protein [Gammaproteobacteria bacterium]